MARAKYYLAVDLDLRGSNMKLQHSQKETSVSTKPRGSRYLSIKDLGLKTIFIVTFGN